MEYSKFLIGLVCVLVFNNLSVSAVDPKLLQCRDKLMKQASLVKFNQLPSCFNPKSLEEFKNNTQTFGKLFFNQVPQKCVKPEMSNIKECWESVNKILQSKSNNIKSLIVGSINAIFYGSKDCIKDLQDRFTNVDKYITNGCSD